MGRSRVRRPLTALLVATVVAVSLAVALTAVQALGGDDIPETFQVRAPHVGDRGVYEATLHGEWFYDDFVEGEPFEFLRFEWLDDTQVRGEDGFLHDANVLHVQGLSYLPVSLPGAFGSEGDGEDHQHWYGDDSSWYLRPGGHEAIAQGGEQELATQQTLQTAVLGVPVLDNDVSGDFHTRMLSLGGPGACFLRTPLQDGAADTDRPVDVPPCTLRGLEGWDSEGPDSLRAVGTETIGGLETVRFEGPGGNSVWYASGVSAPVRIQIPSPPHHDFRTGETSEMEGHAVLDLVAFEPGTTPVAPTAGTPHSPLPAVSQGDRMPWGLDDNGVDHPFPASAAYVAAVADEDAGLGDYLDSHPDAVVTHQAFSVIKWNDEDVYQWRFGYSDGTEAFGVAVALHVEQSDRHVLGTDLPLPPEVTHTIEVGEDPIALVYAGLPDFSPADVPDTLPTAASLLERWRVAVGRSALPEAPAYGAQLWCHDGCRYVLDVGVDTTDFSDDDGVVVATATGRDVLQWDLSTLAMEQDGAILRLTELLVDYSMTTSIATPGGGVAPEPGAAQEAPLLSAGAIIPVGGEEAALVGAAALLSAALYWLWPVLKTTPLFGLFSRLRTPELLEHPNRRAVHDAIAASPGIHFKGLQRETGLANGTLNHHLRHLVDGGLVAQRSGGRYTCYFPAGRIDARAMTASSLLKSDGSRAVLQAVERRPGITAREVADGTGLSPGTVAYHIDRLAGCGAVVKDRDGRQVRLHVSAWAAPTLDAA